MGAADEVASTTSKAIARAGVVAIFAAALLGAQIWSSYRRDERDAAHLVKLETAIDRFAEAAQATTRAMDALRTDTTAGRVAAVQTLAEQIKTCCSRRQ